MRVLITGTSGFIGYHLASRLLDSGHEVIGVDCLTDFYSTELKLVRNTDLKRRFPRFRQFEIDLATTLDEGFLHGTRFDQIIHLAGQPGVRLPVKLHDLYSTHNFVATTKILQFARLRDIERVLFASSSSVYGNSDSFPLNETSSSTRPVSVYGASKLATEALASSYSAATGLITRGLRFFTAYGSWGRPDMAYFRLIASALGEWNFTLSGDGHLQRDFTHVSDVVEGITRLSQELASRPSGFSDVVNVGGGRPRSMLELIAAVESATGRSLTFSTAPLDSRDVNRTEADFSTLELLTGHRPLVDLEDGIRECVDWASRPDVTPRLRDWIHSVQ